MARNVDAAHRNTMRPSFQRLTRLVLYEDTGMRALDYVGRPRPTVSRNLSVLRNAGLVKWRRIGISKYYSLDNSGDIGPLKRKVMKAYCGGIVGT